MFTGPLFQNTTFTKYWLTQWISKLPGCFEIYVVRQYLVNFTGLVGLLNATVYKAEPIFTCLWAWQIVLILNTAMTHIWQHIVPANRQTLHHMKVLFWCGDFMVFGSLSRNNGQADIRSILMDRLKEVPRSMMALEPMSWVCYCTYV